MPSRLIPALAGFEPLLGEWSVLATYPEHGDVAGEMRIEPFGAGAFVSVTTRMEAGFPNGYGLIGRDDAESFYQMIHYDDHQNSRVFACVFNGRRWEMWRRAKGRTEKFIGQLSPNGDRIEGKWESSEDGVNWSPDQDIIYRRAG